MLIKFHGVNDAVQEKILKELLKVASTAVENAEKAESEKFYCCQTADGKKFFAPGVSFDPGFADPTMAMISSKFPELVFKIFNDKAWFNGAELYSAQRAASELQ